MAAKTSIEWTDGGATWNPIRARALNGAVGWHCEIVSPGCELCYAQAINKRLGTGDSYLRRLRDAGTTTFLDEKMLLAPLRWKKPRMIFVGSMTDLFGDWVTDEMLDRIFAVMALCPQHTFQCLTKRADRMRDYLVSVLRNPFRVAIHAESMQRGGPHTPPWLSNAYQSPKSPPHEPIWPLGNCWLGVSVEDQRRADERIPLLLQTPAAVRWVSAEPLLGPVDLQFALERCHAASDGECFAASCPQIRDGESARSGRHCPLDDWLQHERDETPPRLDWIVVGGESGPGARPFHLDWARSIVSQCKGVGVPCFVKQLGARPVQGTDLITRYPTKDRKGGDPAEWPEDLRVREYPEAPHG